MKHINNTYIWTLIVLLFISCTKIENASFSGTMENDTPTNEINVVTIDEALQNLESFLSDVQFERTKSTSITFSSIETHYSNSAITKSGDLMPDAYLVNFENDEGYAVLGANTAITPIIAVVENGNTDWETLLSADESTDSIQEISDEPDILGPGIEPEQLVAISVKGALYGNNNENDSGSNSTTNVDETLPLLSTNYNFGQQVTYCHKNNGKFVTNGCAATAISMIVAYNKYPRMNVDNVSINFANRNTLDGSGIYYRFSDDYIYVQLNDYFTNSSSIPMTLTNDEMISLLQKIDSDITKDHGTPSVTAVKSFYRTRYKLISGIYYTLNNIIKNWNGTGTMPAAAVNGLEDLGYTDVDKTKKKELTSAQITTITNMLKAGKPVLMCGWSLGSLSESHYWVVDGIKKENGKTLIHCNWGWSGSSNGWFASDCIRSDSPVATKSSDANNGWNNIIVFSYNMSATTPSRTVNEFYNEHRVKY